MGFGNNEILAGRVVDANDFLSSVEPAKLTEIDAQVSDYIFQRTNFPSPTDPSSAPGILRGIWADIVLFKVIKWQKNLSEEEVKRRTILKDDAERLLNLIESGKISIKTNSSTPATLVSVSGKKRISTP